MSKWIRTCQECGSKQEDKKPEGLDLSDAYCNKKCKKCKSEALDFGSPPSDDKEMI